LIHFFVMINRFNKTEMLTSPPQGESLSMSL
jgi:hypothetical protein